MQLTKINDKLKELYNTSWTKLSTKLNEVINNNNYLIKPTNPLLINLSDEENYKSSDIKVMIFGQETNDWEGPFYNDLDKISNVYNNFYQEHKFAHKGHFKNHFNGLITLFENKFPNKKIGFIWNNVIKVGKSYSKGTPPKYILDIIKDEFSVLQQEIDILRPNIILFLSGPNYDKYIIEQIPNIEKNEINGFAPNVLASFNIKNVDYVFRTYHPNKINFLGKQDYNKIYNTILAYLNYE